MAQVVSPSNLRKIPTYAWISLAAFICFLLVFGLFLFNSEKFVRLGLTEPVYYLVLVVMGLASAVFLFGVLSSSATFEGTVLGGTLKMGGPIVAVALVVYGGHFFIPKGFTFPLTVIPGAISGTIK